MKTNTKQKWLAYCLSLLLFLAYGGQTNAQNYVWAKQIGGTGDEEGRRICVDAFGNVYTTGYFQGTVDFDPSGSTFALTTTGNYDVFVSKLDASGNFVWAKNMGGTGYDLGYGITLDASGNVYIVGSFEGTVDFDPNAGVFNLTSAGGSDVFVSKLDPSGNLVWAKQIGGTDSEIAYDVTLDTSGNVYFIGNFASTADFDPSGATFNLVSSGSNDIFVSKLDASGNFVWAKSMGGASSELGFRIAVSASNDVYTTGGFDGTVDFDPSAGVANLTNSNGAMFVSKLDASGNFVWAKSIGGTSSVNVADIVIDTFGNVYTVGQFYGTTDFDPGVATSDITAVASSGDIFINKLNVSGDFVWTKNIGSAGDDRCYGIALDAANNLYTTGFFEGTVDFDPNVGTVNLISTGIIDIFVSKLDASGNLAWARSMPGTFVGTSNAITVDASSNIYITGRFKNTVDFDPNAGVANLTFFGGDDVFVSKLSQPQPEINLQGNTQNITDGDASPTTADHTDFTVTGISTSLVRTFTIQNTGAGTLNITSIGNTNTTDYTVGGLSLPATISAGSSTTFTVTLNSATLGTKMATITVNSDDADEGVYDFAITGRVINATPSVVRGNMMSFDGVGTDYVTIGDIAALKPANELTVEAWIRTNNTGATQQTIISTGGDVTVRGYHINTSNGNIWFNNEHNPIATSAGKITAGVWHHVAITYHAGVSGAQVYIDGKLEASNNVSANPLSYDANPLGFGTLTFNPTFYNYDGKLDEVRIWNVARTQAQIRENMHLTLSGVENGLVAYYQFNETSGNAIDAVAGNNGTLQNAPTRPTSTVSVAKGVSTRQTVSATGNQVFGNATVNFTAMSAPAANDEFVAYQLYDRPMNNVSATSTASNYWIVRQFGSQTFSYDQMSFTLPASNVISTTAPASDMKLFKRTTNSGGAWGTEVGTGTSASNVTKIVAYNLSPAQMSFSEFSVASVSSPLPITLVRFGGERVEKAGEKTEEVKLDWSTAQEINNKGFEVEMSEDGLAYQKIAFVEGRGSGNIYHLSFINSSDGYYRLKQVDFDGSFSYSPIVFVEGVEGKIAVYPNPNKGAFTIEVGKDKLDSPARLLNAQGKEVWRGVQTEVRTTDLPTGVYFLHTTVAGKTNITKVVIER